MDGTPASSRLTLSGPIEDLPAADVMCTGRIVRAEHQTPDGSGPALAATIDSYSFVHP
jgi:hypothetical protein